MGEKVFSVGEPGDSLYIVGTGSVELYVKDTTGTKIVLTVCGPREVFGELSRFDGGGWTASAVVLEAATLLVLDRDDLLDFLRHRPDAALDLLTMMGQRIRSRDEMLRRHVARNINEEMEIRSTTVERIADVIAAFSGSIQFPAMNALWFDLCASDAEVAAECACRRSSDWSPERRDRHLRRGADQIT